LNSTKNFKKGQSFKVEETEDKNRVRKVKSPDKKIEKPKLKPAKSGIDEEQESWNEDFIQELNENQMTLFNGKNKILAGLEDYT